MLSYDSIRPGILSARTVETMGRSKEPQPQPASLKFSKRPGKALSSL